VGTPAQELHGKAHVLEHIHDPASVEYLDDLLGHPIRDPHGTVIPQDAATVERGIARLSLLREGTAGVVESVGVEAVKTGIKAGETIQIGPRVENQRIWIVWRADGAEVRLHHRAADAISVRILPGERKR